MKDYDSLLIWALNTFFQAYETQLRLEWPFLFIVIYKMCYIELKRLIPFSLLATWLTQLAARFSTASSQKGYDLKGYSEILTSETADYAKS